jgi:hypothetical protein
MRYRKRNNSHKNNGQASRANTRAVATIVSPGVQGQTAPVRTVEQNSREDRLLSPLYNTTSL